MRTETQHFEASTTFADITLEDLDRPVVLAKPHHCKHCSKLRIGFDGENESSNPILVYRTLDEILTAFRECSLIHDTFQSLRELSGSPPIQEEELHQLLLAAIKRTRARWTQILHPFRPKRHANQVLCELYVQLSADLHPQPVGAKKLSAAQNGERSVVNIYQCSFDWALNGTRTALGRQYLLSANYGDSVAKWVASRPISRYTAGDWSFTLAKNWLERCQHSHPRCSKVQFIGSYGLDAPRRLIDLGAGIQDQPRLMEIQARSHHVDYAALSYCWGADSGLVYKSTIGNMKSLFQGLLMDELPRTITDAFEVCRKLGIRYLWVDSVCIVQDDPADKAAEMGKMASIFRNALVTICAASGASCKDGFLNERRPYDCTVGPPVKLSFSLPDERVGSVLAEPLAWIGRPGRREAIQKRAWTLQEYLLSGRILWFGSQQLRWICNESQHIDGGDSSHETHMPSPFNRATESANTWHDWYEMLADYSMRSMKRPEDKLSAFAGIADEYSLRLKSFLFSNEYFAGIWRVEFPIHLLWYVKGEKRYPRPAYRAPSWSWASVDGPIAIDIEHQNSYRDSLELLEINAQPTYPENKFGAVVSGFLRCKGYLLSGHLTRLHWAGTEFSVKGKLGTLTAEMHFDVWNGMDSMPTELEEVYCIIVRSSEFNYCGGLVLKPTEDNGGAFRRVGMWYSWDSKEGGGEYAPVSEQLFRRLEKIEIKII